MSWILFQQRRQIFRSVIANGSGSSEQLEGIQIGLSLVDGPSIESIQSQTAARKVHSSACSLRARTHLTGL
jgi:hypothetical protein